MEWLKQQIQRYKTTDPIDPPPSPPQSPEPAPPIQTLSPPIIHHSHLHQPPGSGSGGGGLTSPSSSRSNPDIASLASAISGGISTVDVVSEKIEFRNNRRFSDSSYSSTVSTERQYTTPNPSGHVNPAFILGNDTLRATGINHPQNA